MDRIDFATFQKLDLRIARIQSAEAVPQSKKLIRLIVGLGPSLDALSEAETVSEGEAVLQQQAGSGQGSTIRFPDRKIQILAGIRGYYDPQELVGRSVVVLTNLEPRKMFGLQSQGMLLAVTDEKTKDVSLLVPDREVPPGSRIS